MLLRFVCAIWLIVNGFFYERKSEEDFQKIKKKYCNYNISSKHFVELSLPGPFRIQITNQAY